MNLSLFQIANILLLATLLILLVRFLWMTFFNVFNQPPAWKEAVKEKRVPGPLKKLERFYPDKVRFYSWWFQVERLKREKVPGAFAELGVYKGESAAILHKMDPSRKFHLFDTFEGFPVEDLKGETGKAATYTSNHFADTSVSRVLKKIGESENIRIHQGYFPETATALHDEKFALVNIDADLYVPTKAGLEYFYPLLSDGGVIFIHDCNEKWPGVNKAVDEFCATIPEKPFVVPDRDGTVVVVKGSDRF